MYIEREELDILINCVPSDANKLFIEFTNFEDAINVLKRAFFQEKNEIYTRHVLPTKNPTGWRNSKSISSDIARSGEVL